MPDVCTPFDHVKAGGWIDAHCHLQEQYGDEGTSLSERVAEAIDAGVTGVVCVGTDVTTSLAAVAVARAVRRRVVSSAAGEGNEDTAGKAQLTSQNPPSAERLPGTSAGAEFSGWATMGIHPHEAAAGTGALAGVLRDALAAGDPVVAVGECGLDYHYDHAERAAQRRTFADQIALANALDLALVVHTREAWDDTLDILRTEGAPKRTVIHCFTGGADEARRCLDLGAYLSFSGIVTFKSATDIRIAAALCPVDRLLVETDAPFLAPVPHRGKVNRPAWVSVVGEAVADLRQVSPAALAETTRAATGSAFGLIR